MENSDIRRYTKGQIVTARVERVLPFGAFVRLADGTRAYIRRREISLERDLDPREVLIEGQEIRAVVLQPGKPGQNMELSRRALLPDPWEEFARQFREGDVVVGTVKDLVFSGVFVQIRPGVEGFIPVEELATWKVERPEDVVWVGDRVEAVITRLDPGRQKVWLSIRQRIRQLNQVVMAQLYRDTEPLEGTDTSLKESSSIDKVSPRVNIRLASPVLVVENDHALKESLVEWLEGQGCQCDGAGTAIEALDLYQRRDYGLVLVDLDLPGMDGLSLIRHLRKQDPLTPVAVMSSLEWIEQHLEDLQALEVVDIFPKPLDPDDVQRLLAQLARGEKPRLNLEPPEVRDASKSDHDSELRAIMRSAQPLARRLQTGLEYLVTATRAEKGIVFHLDPVSERVTIVAEAGAIPINEAAVYSLIDSPVKDIIREGGEIWDNRVSQARTGRYRELLDLLSFESCIGVPIEACGRVEHALFLFHREPQAFSRYRLRDARAMATLFSTALENQALDERVRELSGLLLSGSLAAVFAHEISNKLSGLELRFHKVRADFESLEQKHPQLPHTFDYREVKRALESAVHTAMDLKRTVMEFSQLTKTSSGRVVNVNRIIHQAVAQMRPLARRADVKLRLNLDQNLPPVSGNSIGLLHVFLNVMLNAVQHMENKPDSKSDGRRVLEVTTVYDDEDELRPVKVRFSDTGPGIHRRLWDKIFALGFTTKQEGSGLGLYIARSLVESMGGRIFVEESLVPLGTTFLVELPAAEESRGVKSDGRRTVTTSAAR